ncbi:universal stress protein [Dulcicalothrix desertica PCC 7102]|uniref:Universal stress protein n=1 Tax=Dulcicalothrix desertica PCC 7102 TaxID=232991 RepID=A0A3S1IY85_9CYAN|nr:universal stress protein [Dulcicalothrix desertica]RUT04374.1 universal stress protein [Dulcicalothrix desertica PCC 7102]TWH51230.1 nucleotide-binding universal stress UspA family protein [Dulcicalothrix desertica PCC 7102]
MFNKILVAVDTHDTCQPVVDKALLLAQLTASNLMLVNVISPFDEQYPPIYAYPNTAVPALYGEVVKEYIQQSENIKQDKIKFLRQLCQQAIDLGIDAEFKILFGDPSRVICEIAQTWNADLIIIGRRGRTGLSEFFLGSVSNYVLHHAPCSVLTVQQSVQANSQELQQVKAANSLQV